MADEASPMHKDFPRWYAAVAIGDEIARREARWEGLSTIVDRADRSTVEALVRLAYGTARQPPSSHQLTRMQEDYRLADETFDPSQASREMEVLAGACLAVLFERDNQVAAAAALSTACASFGGARTPNLPMDLPLLAEVALERMADANRARPSLAGHVNDESPKIDFEAAGAKAAEETGEALIQAFTLAANNIRTAFRTLAARQAKAIRAVDRFIQVQDEELQMLWWLTGGRSFDFDCAFDAVAAEAQPLVFAKELADSTEFLPGPRSIKPLLVRAGLKERKKLTVATALTAAEAGWLGKLVSEASPSPVTEPLHFAIQRQGEAGGGEAWVQGWAAVVGVDGARQLSTLALGVQFYRERLLALFE